MRQLLIDTTREVANRCTYLCQSAHRFTRRWSAFIPGKFSAGAWVNSVLNRVVMYVICARAMLTVESTIHNEPRTEPPVAGHQGNGDPAGRGESSLTRLL